MLKPNIEVLVPSQLLVAKNAEMYWDVFYILGGTLWVMPMQERYAKFNDVMDVLRGVFDSTRIVNCKDWAEVTGTDVFSRKFYRYSNGMSVPLRELKDELPKYRFNQEQEDVPVEDSCAELAVRFPKYWKALPTNWAAIDTYRINHLFPIHGDDSGRLLHARKKLLVPGTRTGGKSIYVDIAEAHATLGAWLADNTPESK